MSQTIILTSGTSFASLAAIAGPQFPIKYCSLFYDPAIDPYVNSTSGAIQISARESPSSIQPLGEQIFNISSFPLSAYSISNNEMIYYYSGQTGTTTITGNVYNDLSYVNLLNGQPISHVISGTSMAYSYPNWGVGGYVLSPAGPNSSGMPSGYATNRDFCFNIVSYQPVTCAAGGLARGYFKVKLPNTIGSFKFNKILLLMAKYSSGGIEDTSVAPVPFAITMLDQPIIKSLNGSNNISIFELDVEMILSASNTFGQFSYLNNNDWNRIPDKHSLSWDGRVAIGSSAIPGSFDPQSQLHIFENTSSTSFSGASHIKLSDLNYNWTSIKYISNVLGAGSLYISNNVQSASMNTFIQGGLFAKFSDGLTYPHSFDGVVGADSDIYSYNGNIISYLGYIQGLNTYASIKTEASILSAGTYAYSENIIGYNSIKTKNLSAVNSNFNAISALNITSNSLSAHHGVFDVIDGGTLFSVLYINSDSTYLSGGYIEIKNPTLSTNIYFSGFQSTWITSNNMGINTPILYLTATSIVNAAMSFSGPGEISFVPRVLVQNLSAYHAVSANDGFAERSRGAKIGDWTAWTPTISAAGDVLSVSAINFARYMLVGKTLFLNFSLSVAARTGGVVTELRIQLPTGFTGISLSNGEQSNMGVYKIYTSIPSFGVNCFVPSGYTFLHFRLSDLVDGNTFGYFSTIQCYLENCMAIEIQ